MDFFNTYGPYILLGIFLIFLIVTNVVRNKKYASQTNDLLTSLKKGDYVKTYSGIYGTILKIEEIKNENLVQPEKIVTLETGENSSIRIDIRAVMQLVNEFKPKVKKATDKK